MFDLSRGLAVACLGPDKMRPLKRKRIEEPRIATLEDVHPHTKWNMCVRLYHKFHVENFAPSTKRLYMVLLDERVLLFQHSIPSDAHNILFYKTIIFLKLLFLF